MPSVAALFDEAMKLSPSERGKLVVKLIESIGPGDPDDVDQAEIEAAWAAEYEERIARLECGESTTIDWRESTERLRESLERRRQQRPDGSAPGGLGGPEGNSMENAT